MKGNSKQDSLDDEAFDALKKEFGGNSLTAGLWRELDGTPLLLKKLHHYTRKNKHDFFIHKNLKGFLERELDFYIKSELVRVDDLYVTDSDAHFDRLRHNLKSIKVFKAVADVIIAFVSQIEDFQKKLWEKKKFVLGTEWIITLDRLVTYLGEAAARPILEEALANEPQVAEWKALFGEKVFADWKKLTLADLETKPAPKPAQLNLLPGQTDTKLFKKLPIDTKHFAEEFKWALLNALSEKIDLEEKADGLVIHSDNYQGLNILGNKFEKQLRCTYIDPPYNTGTDGFNYKDNYKNSSWLSSISDRFEVATKLVKPDGASLFSIDDISGSGLKNILENQYGKDGFLGVFVWKRRITSSMSQSWLSTDHEYVYVYSNSPSDVQILGDDKDKSKYKYDDGDGKLYASMPLTVGMNKMQRANQWYPLINPTTGTEYFPTANRVWCYYPPTMENKILGKRIIWPEDRPNSKMTTPRLKAYIDEAQRDKKPISTWISEIKKSDSDWISFELESGRNEEGTKWLNKLFRSSVAVYPKPISLIKGLIKQFTFNNDYVLDYFAGSGTTFHAVQILNQDEIKRRCILVEQGEYASTLILPRIKKIAYTFDWKDGLPKDDSMNGLGVLVKYQRLEQYEEALENIAFTPLPEAAAQQALAFAPYLPKYFLEFETRGSKSLVNTTAMLAPWDYRLRVWDGFTYDTERAVDLVETFNYLIGLHVQQYRTKTLNGHRYQFVTGRTNAGKQVVVVWRSQKDWTLDDYRADTETLTEELAALLPYDLLYLNGQANLDGYQPIEGVFKNKMLP